ncbi:MAG: HEAT repeat domain-containing protein, partial [Pirellulales bacterium]|nr:HEAT repeat domain-containing protein [Pirellulales bacterium]
MRPQPGISAGGKQRKSLSRFCAWLIAVAAVPAFGQSEAVKNPALDAAFQALSALELGQGLDTFGAIDQAVSQSRLDETIRADLESRLAAVLRGGATALAKDYACRQLAIVGSDASTAVLAELLPDARLSYMARYALEGIGSQAAIQRLREMLGKTQGRQKIGVVVSLGSLCDAAAVPALAGMLDDKDRELREAALTAVGRIGTVEAARILQSFASTASETERNAAIDAELDAAESLCRHGQHEAAAAVCERLLAADSERTRAAAYRGLIAAKPAEKLTMIQAGLAAEASWKRTVAADCLVSLEKGEEIEAIASRIAEFPPAGKLAALQSLKDRSHPAVRKAALVALDHPDAAHRTAALAALIAAGTAEDVPRLAELASRAADREVQSAALETLRLMPAAGTA